jgi:hypothetical protein
METPALHDSAETKTIPAEGFFTDDLRLNSRAADRARVRADTGAVTT